MKFSSYTNFAIKIAQGSGEILKKGFLFSKNLKISTKKGIHNLVTKYDIKSEKFLITSILKKYKNHSILSEEKGSLVKNKKFLWILDPLDGTVNFAHRIPIFSVSIALQIEKEIFSAVIFNPLTKEMFAAEKNKGSYLNGKKIRTSKTKKIEKAIFATSFPYNLKNNPHKCIDKFLKIIKKGIPIRRLGSAAISLSYVADSRFDGFFGAHLGPWDIAAAKLIIEEAGGKLFSWQDKTFKIRPINSIISTNGNLDGNFIKIFKKS